MNKTVTDLQEQFRQLRLSDNSRGAATAPS